MTEICSHDNNIPKTIIIEPANITTTTFNLGDYIGSCESKSNTNTNACLDILINKVPACDVYNNNITDMNALKSCCTTMKDFNNTGCLCNDSIKYMVNLNNESNFDNMKNMLVPLCKIVLADGIEWDNYNCSSFSSTNMGCNDNDMVLEKNRLQTCVDFSAPFDSAGTSNCFDYDKTISYFNKFTDDDISADIPYGIGTFTGFSHAFEYFSMYWNSVNKGLWKGKPFDRTSGNIQLSDSSNIFNMSIKASGSFFDGCEEYSGLKLNNNYGFKSCSSKLNSISINPDNNLTFLVHNIIETAKTDKFGTKDICEYHEKYCTSEGNRQYADYDECYNYISSLPFLSPVCMNSQMPLAGNSQVCRFKHHFMIPLDPDMHCHHIGKDGFTGSMDGKLKCNDVECQNSDGSPFIPPINWAQLKLTSTDLDKKCIELSNNNSSKIAWQPPNLCVTSI